MEEIQLQMTLIKETLINLNKKTDFLESALHNLLSYNRNNINIHDINVFNIISKKKDNDFSNKLRENIISSMINENVPLDWFIKSETWKLLKTKLLHTICTFFSDDVFTVDSVGGLKNHDFNLNFTDRTVKLEFKYNQINIFECPEVLSLHASALNTYSYSEFFYDYYLVHLLSLYDIVSMKPDKATYLKYIHQFNYSKHKMFEYLYRHEKDDHKIFEKKKYYCKKINRSVCL